MAEAVKDRLPPLTTLLRHLVAAPGDRTAAPVAALAPDPAQHVTGTGCPWWDRASAETWCALAIAAHATRVSHPIQLAPSLPSTVRTSLAKALWP